MGRSSGGGQRTGKVGTEGVQCDVPPGDRASRAAVRHCALRIAGVTDAAALDGTSGGARYRLSGIPKPSDRWMSFWDLSVVSPVPPVVPALANTLGW